MKASDVMTSPVITVSPNSSIRDVAKILLTNHISAVPVLDSQDKLVGIVTEADLLHRVEAGTERRRAWWLRPFVDDQTLAADYVKSHSLKVADVMTRNVITAEPETALHAIARLLEKHAIKRVPILSNGRLVGIVSRANLIQAVANPKATLDIALADSTIRDKIQSHLKAQPWAHTMLLNVTVHDGIAELWGFTQSDVERNAVRVAAQSVAGVRMVTDNLVTRHIESGI